MLNMQTLDNKETQDQLSVTTDTIVEQNLIPEAKEIANLINNILQKNVALKQDNIDIYNKLNSYIAKAQFVFIHDLNEGDLIELFEKYLHLVLDLEYDLIAKIKHRFVIINDLQARDELKAKLREAILKNKAKVTKNKIKIGSIDHDSTISNWLKDYYSKLGVEQINALALNQYLVNDENTKKLNEAEKNRLKKIFNLFEHLKSSSTELKGLEENFVAILPDGRISIIDGGVPLKIDANVEQLLDDVKNHLDQSNIGINDDVLNSQIMQDSQDDKIIEEKNAHLKNLSEALSNYSPTSLEYKAIKEEINRLRKQSS